MTWNVNICIMFPLKNLARKGLMYVSGSGTYGVCHLVILLYHKIPVVMLRIMAFEFWFYPDFNTLRPRQNGSHFADDIFKCIFLNENVWISINISFKFVPQSPLHNISALIEILAWRRPGDKLLSGPIMVRLPRHICVTRPQWVKHRT